MFKKIIKVDNKEQVCLIFGQIDLEHFLGGKLTTVNFFRVLCPIIIQCLNQKEALQRIMRYKDL